MKKLKKVTDLSGNECIHCKTFIEACKICELMDNNQLKWFDGDSYLNKVHRNEHKSETVYYPARGLFGYIEYAQKKNYTIYSASDFIDDRPIFYDSEGTEIRSGDEVWVNIRSLDLCKENKEKHIFLFYSERRSDYKYFTDESTYSYCVKVPTEAPTIETLSGKKVTVTIDSKEYSATID